MLLNEMNTGLVLQWLQHTQKIMAEWDYEGAKNIIYFTHLEKMESVLHNLASLSTVHEQTHPSHILIFNRTVADIIKWILHALNSHNSQPEQPLRPHDHDECSGACWLATSYKQTLMNITGSEWDINKLRHTLS